MPSVVCRSRQEKWETVLAESQDILAKGRALLIGTRSISASQELAVVLQNARIDCFVLNATNPQQEAAIIACAGHAGRVTVATNMAGRGTDIEISDSVRAAGGMHVIGTELHASERIDRQLAGRCGRQGDPGSFRQYMAFDDELLSTAWGHSENPGPFLQWATARNFNAAEKLFRRAQKIVSLRQQSDRVALSLRGESLRELYRQLGINDVFSIS